MKTNTLTMISAGPVTLTGTKNSDAIFIGQSMGACIQAVFTGTPAGTFKLQVSNDQGPNETIISANQAPVVNWSDYTGSSVVVAAAGDWTWDVTITNARWIRVVYTAASSTGTLTSLQCNVKG